MVKVLKDMFDQTALFDTQTLTAVLLVGINFYLYCRFYHISEAFRFLQTDWSEKELLSNLSPIHP